MQRVAPQGNVNPSLCMRIRNPSGCREVRWKALVGYVAIAAAPVFIFWLAGWTGLLAMTGLFLAVRIISRRDTPERSRELEWQQQGHLIYSTTHINNVPFYRAEVTREKLEKYIPPFLHANKEKAYQKLMENRPHLIEDNIICTKVEGMRYYDTKVFDTHRGHRIPPELHLEAGGRQNFPYPPGQNQWTAINVSQQDLFSTAGTFALPDRQVIEHPGLYHLYETLRKEKPAQLLFNQTGSTLLIEHARRYGQFADPLPAADLAQLPPEEFAPLIQPIQDPQANQLFTLHISPPSPELRGRPYSLEQLKEIFLSFHAPFRALHFRHDNSAIHLGNFELDFPGHNVKTLGVLMLLAARHRIKNISYYSSRQPEPAIREAEALLNQIGQQHPQIKTSELLQHLADHAAEYGLLIP